MKPERYRREPALRYAARWAMGRNPAYYDFTDLGGDCTNFVSQCLFAGGCRMNFTPESATVADSSCPLVSATLAVFTVVTQDVSPKATQANNRNFFI